MGRWSHLDSDDDRLPVGMSRVGYDADTQIYSYRDADGSLWEGAPGCKYGTLHRVRCTAPPLPSVQVPDDVEGDEQPYVLHNYDVSSESDGDQSYQHGDDDTFTTTDDDDEKKHLTSLVAAPTKAKLHSPNPQKPHHDPAPGKTLPNLPELRKTLTGTTVGESTISTLTDDGTAYTVEDEKLQFQDDSQNQPTRLKRAGTFSRLARFLSSASSSASADARARAVSRRATVAGRDQGSTPAGESGRWPGSGPGSGAGTESSVPRKRATTFDEILGVAPSR